MSIWNHGGGKRNKNHFLVIGLCGLFIFIIIIITFLIAVQLVLFPTKNHASFDKETDNHGTQHDNTITKELLLPTNDPNSNFDNGVIMEPSPGLTHQASASLLNTVLTSTAHTMPTLGKGNSQVHSSSKGLTGKPMVKTGHSPLKKGSSLNGGSKRKVTATSANTIRRKTTATKSANSHDQDLEGPPQEVKNSMILPSPGTDNGSTGTKVTYVTKKNDTVNIVAAKFGITPESIYQVNGLSTSTGELMEGQSLTILIPGNHFYRMKMKETLWRIAQRYGTTVAILQEINKINDITKVKAGELIILPVSSEKVANKKF